MPRRTDSIQSLGATPRGAAPKIKMTLTEGHSRLRTSGAKPLGYQRVPSSSTAIRLSAGPRTSDIFNCTFSWGERLYATGRFAD